MHVVILISLALVAMGSVGIAHLRVVQQQRGHLGLLVALDLVLVVLFATAVWTPATFEAWMQEDNWVEWATVLAFGAATASFARQAWHGTATRHPVSRFLLAGLAAFCLFVAGEEISWGQRMFAFTPPEVFADANFQQETNLHNFLKDTKLLGFPLDTRFVVALIAVGYGLVAPALAMLARRRRAGGVWLALDDVAPVGWLTFVFATLAWVELAYPTKLAGEGAELVLGLAFAAAAWARDPRNDTRPLAGAGLVAFAIGTGVLVQPIVDRLLYGPDEVRVAQAREELDALASDLASPKAWRAKKWRGKQRVHKRMYTALRSGYLRLDPNGGFLDGQASPADDKATTPRRDRIGYLLDPWNNPYWVHYQAKGQGIVLYSFGPNRRRDTAWRRDEPVDIESLRGDDLGVQLPADDLLPTR